MKKEPALIMIYRLAFLCLITRQLKERFDFKIQLVYDANKLSENDSLLGPVFGTSDAVESATCRGRMKR